MVDLHVKLLHGDLTLKDLKDYKAIFESYYHELMENPKFKNDTQNFYAFLMICLDCYTYSDGFVLITDHEYDQVMNLWVSMGEDRLVYPDPLTNCRLSTDDELGTQWELVPHKAAFMVGGVRKIYTDRELENYLEIVGGFEKDHGDVGLILAPKYDGNSLCLEIRDGKVASALTRHDSVTGQNITVLVRGAKNINWFYQCGDGFYKCEVVMHQKDFQIMKETGDANYANRRSACSGIVNTPSNVSLGKYLTLIPLIYYNDKKEEVEYIAPDSIILRNAVKFKKVKPRIEDLLLKIRDPAYPYRVDGVIIYPIIGDKLNKEDIMEDAIAWKVNTAIGLTRVKYPYISIGRTGRATPMLKVEPCDVNETVVTDISLSTFSKFYSMNLHEGEMVEVFSAGDAIPQVRKSAEHGIKNGTPFKLYMRCPHCNSPIEQAREGGEIYQCINPHCPKRQCGKISNFIIKMGITDISDGTVEALFDAGLLKNINDLFYLSEDKIASISGFNTKSAHEIVSKIVMMQENPVPISRFIGSLGIPNISEKRSREIFKAITFQDLLARKKKKIYDKLLELDGFRFKIIDSLWEYINQNHYEIEQLAGHLTLVSDRSYIGNVVFTGFRNPEWEKELDQLGFETQDTVNGKTSLVFAASTHSGKAAKALKKGIPIFTPSQHDEAMSFLKDAKRATERTVDDDWLGERLW